MADKRSGTQNPSNPPPVREVRGSGSDRYSESSKLNSPEALLDKTVEDTFPASDPSSMTPMTGIGADFKEEELYGDIGDDGDIDSASGADAKFYSKSGADSRMEVRRDFAPDMNDPEDVKAFKNDPTRQFQYGRQTEASTLHFERDPHRLNVGNPDIGEVDLGTIEADRPAQPDDSDLYDSADDDDSDREPNREL